MTLAGNMKLRNFVLIAVVAVGAGSVGLYMACSGKKHTEEEKEEKAERHREKEAAKAAAATPDAAVAAAPTPAPTPAPAAAVDLVARAYDTEAIAWKGKTISGDKVKDASHGKPYKLNVYKDAGSPTVDRVKIDLNRNDKFDEKISFQKDGTITLERAPADDEKYTETYHWNGAGWMKASVPAEKSDKK
jgi:hypothetical protein